MDQARRRGPWSLSRQQLLLLLLGILALAGCASPPTPVVQPAPLFPPQVVMERGDYRTFHTDNLQALEQCNGAAGCAPALFNLGFVHAYPPSPYHDPSKALRYFDQLTKKYPQTSWAYQGRAWIALLTKTLTLEDTRRRLQADIRTRDVTIQNLRGRLERSREIDVEIDKKERELLR